MEIWYSDRIGLVMDIIKMFIYISVIFSLAYWETLND